LKPNAYTTMHRARGLRERHPDATPTHALVALTLATFADGPTGTSIRPGYERVAELTGLHVDTVRRAIYWLVARDELRRDKPAWRGSAACFTYTGGMVGSDAPPFRGKVGAGIGNGGADDPTHQSHPSDSSGLPGLRSSSGDEARHPRGGVRGKWCRKHPEEEIWEGSCVRCEEEAYWRARGGRPGATSDEER
jgi:hypothetical protein